MRVFRGQLVLNYSEHPVALGILDHINGPYSALQSAIIEVHIWFIDIYIYFFFPNGFNLTTSAPFAPIIGKMC